LWQSPSDSGHFHDPPHGGGVSDDTKSPMISFTIHTVWMDLDWGAIHQNGQMPPLQATKDHPMSSLQMLEITIEGLLVITCCIKYYALCRPENDLLCSSSNCSGLHTCSLWSNRVKGQPLCVVSATPVNMFPHTLHCELVTNITIYCHQHYHYEVVDIFLTSVDDGTGISMVLVSQFFASSKRPRLLTLSMGLDCGSTKKLAVPF
jgi:hypothetical protein